MMQAVSLSKKGEKSDLNEDACLVLVSRGLYVVADGVGGGPRGDFASRVLVDELYKRCISEPIALPLLLDAIQHANLIVFNEAQKPDLNGMASTVAVAWVSDGKLITIHAGDSRVYLLGERGVEQITRDHVKPLSRGDNSTRLVVTNAVGVRDTVRLETSEHDLQGVEGVLLVTDGITDPLDSLQIQTVVLDQSLSLAGRVSQLIEESENQGGRDDKTVILALRDW